MNTKWTLSLLCLMSATLYAAGGESGGGGAYVLVDGEMKISDLFYKSVPQSTPAEVKAITYQQFPQAVKRATDHLLKFASAQTKLSLESYVDVGAVYFLLPKGKEHLAICSRYVADVNRPVDENLQFGCTNGNVTYLFVDVFERANLRDQAHGILHERLWTVNPTISHEEVAAINTGIHLAEDISIRQLGGDLSALSGEEFSTLQKMKNVATKFGLDTRPVPSYEITDHGGYVKKGCLSELSRDNVIGIGSVIDCDGRKSLIKNSVVLGSNLKNQYWIESSSFTTSTLKGHSYTPSSQARWLTMINSTVDGNLLVDGTKLKPALIKNSRVNGASKSVGVRAGSLIQNSSLVAADGLTVGEEVSLKDINFWLAGPVRLATHLEFKNKLVLEKGDFFVTLSKECWGDIKIAFAPKGSPKKPTGSSRDRSENEFDYKAPCKVKLDVLD